MYKKYYLNNFNLTIMQIQICDDFAKKKTIKTMNYKGSVSVLIYISFLFFYAPMPNCSAFVSQGQCPLKKCPVVPLWIALNPRMRLHRTEGTLTVWALGVNGFAHFSNSKIKEKVAGVNFANFADKSHVRGVCKRVKECERFQCQVCICRNGTFLRDSI